MDPVKVVSVLDQDILNLVYSMGAMNKKQLIEKISIKKIQSWYRKKIEEYRLFAREVANPKSMSIRLINREYDTPMLMNYPFFAQNRVGIQADFSGTKRSDVIKWMMTNMTGPQLSYVGF